MRKLVKNVRKFEYTEPIKCPNCGRMLGNVNEIDGLAKITIKCKQCGDVSVELEN